MEELPKLCSHGSFQWCLSRRDQNKKSIKRLCLWRDLGKEHLLLRRPGRGLLTTSASLEWVIYWYIRKKMSNVREAKWPRVTLVRFYLSSEKLDFLFSQWFGLYIQSISLWNDQINIKIGKHTLSILGCVEAWHPLGIWQISYKIYCWWDWIVRNKETKMNCL